MRSKLALLLLLLLSLMLGVSWQISPSPTQGEDSATDQILNQLSVITRQVDLLKDMSSTLSTVLNRLSDIENGLTELKAGQTLMKEKIKEVDKTLQAHNVMTAELNQNCCELHIVESSMTTLTNKVHSLASKVDSLSNTAVLLASDTKILSSKVCDLDLKTDNLTQTVNAQNSQISTLSAKIWLLDYRVDSLINTTDSIFSHTGTLTSKVDVLDSSIEVLTNTITPLPTQVDILTSAVEGVRVGQLAQQQVTEEVKGNLSLLREMVEDLQSKVDTHANTTTALNTSEESTTEDTCICNKTVELLNTMLDSQKQHPSRLPNPNSTSLSSCQQLAEDYSSAPSGYYWVRNRDGCPVSSYCIITSPSNPVYSCQQLAQDHPQGASGYYWVKDRTNSTVRSYCIITSQQNPASSCQQLAQDHPQGASGYYWVRDGTNNTVSYYCIITSKQNPACSCQQLAQDHPQGASGYYWVRDGTNNTVSYYCIITSQLNPATSCQQLAQDHSQGASGYYWVRNGTNNTVSSYCIIGSCQQLAKYHPQSASGYYRVRNGTGQLTKVYCDMERHCCNSTGGWMRVAYVDMTDPSQQCPSGLHLRTDGGVRSCKIVQGGCTSTTFPSHGIEYSRVCGRVRAYQYWTTGAFNDNCLFGHGHGHFTIDSLYVDGVSITHGSFPRKHIWTFAAAYSEYYSNQGACPCTRTDQPYTGAVPPFVGQDYFCDTAVTATERWPSGKLYTNDPLWDGQGCGPTNTCCSFNSPPWFCKQLPQPTTDDIELRMCGGSSYHTPFDHIELYIQ